MGFYEACGNRPVVITLVVCACCDIKKICVSIGILVSVSSGGSPSRHSRWPGDLSIAMSWSTVALPVSSSTGWESRSPSRLFRWSVYRYLLVYAGRDASCFAGESDDALQGST